MDIYETVFYDILQIDRSSTLITGEFGHDMVFGLLIPSILLILILREFGKFFAGDSKLAGTLVPIAGLAAIIVGGFYGVIAQFSTMLFILMLAMFIIVYFKRRLITRGQEGAITGAISSVAGDEVSRALKRTNPGERKKAERKLLNLAVEWAQLEDHRGTIVDEETKDGIKDKDFTFGGMSAKQVIAEGQKRQRDIVLEMIDLIGLFHFKKKDVEKIIARLNSPHEGMLKSKIDIAFRK